MKQYFFHPEALQEYTDAALYYLNISPELSKAFINEIENSIKQIIKTPEAWPVIEEDIHRYLLHRFSYGIYFTTENDNSILIVAIMHMSRKPGYWKTRIK